MTAAPIPRTELHRHLDVSTRSRTLLELARAVGIEGAGTTLEEFRHKTLIREPMAGLSDVLARFTTFQRVLDRPEHLQRVAYETVHDCAADEVSQVELRFSPSWVCEHGSMSWDDALASFALGAEAALAELQGMRAGLICIASRDYGPDSVAQTVEFYLRNRSRLIGFDLAGDEAGHPARLFEQALQPLLDAKRERPDEIHITIHAGEASGPESVWEALELLGAERIGHGIRAFEDPLLLEHLRREQICLEMCPTSNRLTRAVPDLVRHPLREGVEQGIPVTISTDDPGIFDVTLSDELRIARTEIGLSDEQVERCLANAADHTFLGSPGELG
jgi:adenosine deaminase